MIKLTANDSDVLILSWSATGRSRKVATKLQSIMTSAGISADHHDASCGDIVKFRFHQFFGLFPPVVLGKVLPDFNHWVFTPKRQSRPKLIVLVWPVWFLSVPAFVTNSLSNISKSWPGVPILTVVTCRRAWISAAREWRLQVAAQSLPFCGISIIRESRPGLLSFFLTPLRILFRPSHSANFELGKCDLSELARISSKIHQTIDWNESLEDSEFMHAIQSDNLGPGEAMAYECFQAYARFLVRRRWVSVEEPSYTPYAVNFLTIFFILMVGFSSHLLPRFALSRLLGRQLRTKHLRHAA
ncbi:MAG: hypothetical protein NTV34_03060 [Proteobacteria bacterium]|nr:hypothetical protein [Pseudomonadota bacterium]